MGPGNEFIANAMSRLIPRLLNTNVNPRVGMVPKVYQRAVYKHGQVYAPGLEGGMPAWVYGEFSLQAQETQDTTMPLPVGFNLLSVSGLSFTADLTPRDFRVQIYDVNTQRDLIPGKQINGGNIGGNQGKVTFLVFPYFFQGEEPQVQLRVSNLYTDVVTLQFALYGIQGVFPK